MLSGVNVHCLMKGCFWPEARDRHDSPKLSITCSSKPVSGCFRGLGRNGTLGQKRTTDMHLRTTASVCMSGLSPDGRHDRACTNQRYPSAVLRVGQQSTQSGHLPFDITCLSRVKKLLFSGFLCPFWPLPWGSL